MDIYKSIGGMVSVALTSADPAEAMTQIYRAGIPVYNAYRDETDIVVHFQIDRKNYRKLKVLSEEKGYSLKLNRRFGIYWSIRSAMKRPVLMIGLIFFCIITLYLPSRVLFFQVEGNATIPTKLILEKCQQCGISFGVSRARLRSERMKNALLEAIPQLQWAGINTSGCTAVISVRERSDLSYAQECNRVCSIVACRDGIITQCTATKGSLLCKPGQAVKTGEVLVSGYTDCGICIQATQAEGEIFARTERKLSVVTPAKWLQKEQILAVEKKYALIIGKKRINFYKDSGILDTTCDKMYSEAYLTLPGGFRLPVIWVTEIHTYRSSSQILMKDPPLSESARNTLQQQMVSGTILAQDEILLQQDDLYRLEGKYVCIEMIGRIRNEEIIKPYE